VVGAPLFDAGSYLATEGVRKAVATILADVTEVVRKAGRSHHELLRAEELPVAGNA